MEEQGDEVVKLLACGAIGPEFDSRRYDFRDSASNSRYCQNIAKAAQILKTANQHWVEYEYTT